MTDRPISMFGFPNYLPILFSTIWAFRGLTRDKKINHAFIKGKWGAELLQASWQHLVLAPNA
jgi:hypothetical protein